MSVPLVAISVMTTLIRRKYRDQVRACRATWGKIAAESGIKVVNYGGYYSDPEFGEVVNLPGVTEDVDSAFDKQFYGLYRLMHDHPASFYLVVGTDNYVVIPHLIRELKKFDPTQDLFLGSHDDVRQMGPHTIKFHSGAGLVISHSLAVRFFQRYPPPIIFSSWRTFCQTHRYSPLVYRWCDVALAYFIQTLYVNSSTVPLTLYPQAGFPLPLRMEPSPITLAPPSNVFQTLRGIQACSYRGKAGNEHIKCCERHDLSELVVGHYMEAPSIYECHEYYYPHSFTPSADLAHWTLVTSFFEVSQLSSFAFLAQLQVSLLIYCHPSLIHYFTEPLPVGVQILSSPEQDKLALMKQAIIDRADSTHYGWIDFNLDRTVGPSITQIHRALALNQSKISLCCTHYHHKTPSLATSFFTGSKEHILATTTLGENIERCELYFGGEEEVVINYDWQRVNPQITLKSVLEPARNEGAYAIGLMAGNRLWKSYLGGHLYLSSAELVKLFDEYYIPAFYLGKREVVDEILTAYRDQYLLNEYNRSIDYPAEAQSRLGHIVANTDYALPYYSGDRVEIKISTPADLSLAHDRICSTDGRRYFIYIDQPLPLDLATCLINRNPVIRPLTARININYSASIDLRAPT